MKSLIFAIFSAFVFIHIVGAHPMHSETQESEAALGDNVNLVENPSIEELSQNLSNEELFKALLKMVQTLIKAGKMDKVAEISDQLRNLQKKARLDRCLRAFGSQAICSGNSPFYMWAQVVAKDIVSSNFGIIFF